MFWRMLCTSAAFACAAAPAFSQTGPPPSSLPDPSPRVESRPATATPMGDTGLWFVPTAGVLPSNHWSASVYGVNANYEQGFTNVADWPAAFGYGLKDRVELFGSWSIVRRIDRDSRPIFRPDDRISGGLVNEYPFAHAGWSGAQPGDLWIGGKINVASEWRSKPIGVAIRGMIKLPTASASDGFGTGKTDVAIDAVASREINRRIDLSGYAGVILRGDPAGVDVSNGVRYGAGAAFATRQRLRLIVELHGESQTDDVFYAGSARIVGEDGSLPPLVSAASSPVDVTIAVAWIGKRGVDAGIGMNWRPGLDVRSQFGPFEDVSGDMVGFQFRIGYHPGVRVRVE
jgi:hypothetical protein